MFQSAPKGIIESITSAGCDSIKELLNRWNYANAIFSLDRMRPSHDRMKYKVVVYVSISIEYSGNRKNFFSIEKGLHWNIPC